MSEARIKGETEKERKKRYREMRASANPSMMRIIERIEALSAECDDAEVKGKMDYDEIYRLIMDPRFHAVNFLYKGEPFGFAGWWMLYWGEDGEFAKDYDSKEEFLADPVFDGRTLREAFVDTSKWDFEYES